MYPNIQPLSPCVLDVTRCQNESVNHVVAESFFYMYLLSLIDISRVQSSLPEKPNETKLSTNYQLMIGTVENVWRPTNPP